MNVTKKSVKEEWVWQSESLDFVCLYIYIYIYIGSLQVDFPVEQRSIR